MNAAQRRHYAAIHQLARDEWPAETPLEGDLSDRHELDEAEVK
ncbi:hypothetical protein OED01_10605 [Microbacterium sp. M28]|nr:hypothetical protein [Microbacterium sp. M28]UYO96055.1 hypothetical protein OED01_10605 [Microbacterium sp. M28]